MTVASDQPGTPSFERLSFERKLIEGLWSPLADVAETCAWSLGHLRAGAAVPTLCETVRERTDLDAVRVAAIRALAEIGDPYALPTLLSTARRGHVAIRLAAIQSLASFPLDQPARDALAEIVKSERSPRLRVRAEQVLRGLKRDRDMEEHDVD